MTFNPKSAAALCLLLALAGAVPARADEPSRKQIYRHTLRATAWVLAGNSQGSGCVVDASRKLLLTNFHVVREHSTVLVAFPVTRDGRVVTERQFYLSGSGTVFRGRVVETDARCDLAAIVLDALPDGTGELPPADASPEASDTIHAVGNPGHGALWEYTSGTVRAVYRKRITYQNVKQQVDARIIETTAPLNPGDSGGPVVNDRGELVGVNASVDTGGQLLNACIDVSEIRDFLEAARPFLTLKTSDDYLKRGIHYHARGNYDRAIADFIEALRLDPDAAAAYYRRGLSYAEKGEPQQAVLDYTEALRRDPHNAGAYRARGDAHANAGRYDQAVADYTEALRLDDKDAVARRNRAWTYLKKGDADQAIADYTEAIRAAPNDPLLHANRAQAHVNKKEYDQATADYTEAIRLDPGEPKWVNARGVVYADHKGDAARAIEDYSAALRLNPEYGVAYYNRGLLRHRRGDLAAALADLTEAVRLLQFAAACNERGEVYKEQGAYDKAVADFTEAIRLNPSYVGAYWNRARTYGLQGKHEQALAEYTHLLAIAPPSDAPALYENRGEVYAARGEYDRAVADYTAALRLDPKYATAYRVRGAAFADKGEGEQAVADLDEALRLDPKDVRAYHTRALVRQDRGEYARAVGDFQEALKVQADDAVAYNGLGWILATCPRAELRDGTRAVEYATKARELTKGKDALPFDTLAAAYAESGRFADAIEQAERAVALAAEGRKGIFRARLELFQAHKPYRVPDPVAPPAAAAARGVHDAARLFSPVAVSRADDQAREIAQKYRQDVLLETFAMPPPDRAEALGGAARAEQDRLLTAWAEERGTAAKVRGIYVLVCKDPRSVQVWVSPEARRAFGEEPGRKLGGLLTKEIRAKRFDAGLQAALEFLDQTLAEAPDEPAPAKEDRP